MNKRENILSVLIVLLSLAVGLQIVDIHYQKHRADIIREQANVSQLKYQEARDENQKLQAALEDRDRHLSQAAERERAAKIRATRSRNRSRTSGSISRQQSSSPQPYRQVANSGGVHDITMYCPTGNRTASGKWPTRGMVATISRSIPFGTRVVIEGLGTYTVEDRIGHGSEYDIFTPSCAEANRFGRKHRRVTILG